MLGQGALGGSNYELRQGPRAIALVHVNGLTVPRKSNIDITLRRFRLPPYVTIRDAQTDDLLARLCLIPKRGFLAEFEDSQCYRLGWTDWFKREWSWTNEAGGTVLLSDRPLWGGGIEFRAGPDPEAERKLALLAVLELAISKLSLPWC